MGKSNQDEWVDVPLQSRSTSDEGEWTDVPVKPEPGLLDQLQEFAARGARIPGGGKTLKSVGKALNDFTRAVQIGGLGGVTTLANKAGLPVKPLPPEYAHNDKSLGDALEKEYGWSPYASIPTDLLTGIVADPTSRLHKAANIIADAMDKGSSGLYQNAFRTVSRSFNKKKQHYLTDAGPAFIERLRTEKVIPGGSDAADAERAIRDWQYNKLGGRMNELREPIKNNVYGNAEDLDEMFDPFYKHVDEHSKDAITKPIVESVEQKLVNPEVESIQENQGISLEDILRKARKFSSFASGKTGAQGDIYKMFARENAAKEGASKVAKGMRDFARARTLEANPGAADEINQLYKDYGNVETAAPALNQFVSNEAGRKPWTQIDSMLAAASAVEGLGHVGNPTYPLTILGAKKLNNYLQSPSGATRVGNLLRDASKTDIWDRLARRALTQNLYGDEK